MLASQFGQDRLEFDSKGMNFVHLLLLNINQYRGKNLI
jgi:hypothetical protein